MGYNPANRAKETKFIHRPRRRIHIPREKRTRIVLVAIIVALILGATIGIAWTLDDMDDNGGSGTSPYVDVTSLEPFGGTNGWEQYVDVGRYIEPYEPRWITTFDYVFEAPDVVGQVLIFFIDYISVIVYWTDEPDEEGFFWGYENEPDTVLFEMADDRGWIDFTREVTNVHGERAEIRFEWNGDGRYFVDAYLQESEGMWDGSVEGWEYIHVDEESVIWDLNVNNTALMVEAGDQVHERLPLIQGDGGNLISYEFTISGYWIRILP